MSPPKYDEHKPSPWRGMHSAPRDGKTKVRLRLKDGYGIYQLRSPCIWLKGRWANAKTFTPIVSEAIGWQPVKKFGGYEDD